MSAMRDIKYIAHLEYDIMVNENHNINFTHEKLVKLIMDIMDTYNLIINLKRKKKELEIILDDYC